MIRKTVYRRGDSLALKLLREGLLDVDIQSGEVISFLRSRKGRLMSIGTDEDGYQFVYLQRERKAGKKDSSGRRRERMKCFVHRLVVMKALALDEATASGRDWRDVVADIPGRHDVDHLDFDRTNNHHENLRCIGQGFNRARRRRDEPDPSQLALDLEAKQF